MGGWNDGSDADFWVLKWCVVAVLGSACSFHQYLSIM